MSAAPSSLAPDEPGRGGGPRRTLSLAWAGVALPPFGWIADFLGRYSVSRYVSVHGARWPLVIPTALGLLGVGGGAALCLIALRQDNTVGSMRVLPRWGLVLAAFFLLLLAAESYPLLSLAPDEIT